MSHIIQTVLFKFSASLKHSFAFKPNFNIIIITILGSSSTAQMSVPYRTFLPKYGVLTVPYRTMKNHFYLIIYNKMHLNDITKIFVLIRSTVCMNIQRFSTVPYKRVRRTVPYSRTVLMLA